ncbi:baculoviral IAP repeat-containing protein 7-like isoform X2 [Stegostoma tigrinum]|uniref:baculoviral IAP repeat-containing protein 7-like isoform X2 n=1 Tax=Stegostoma tigrinum TaxID=3053191 RepID=UPI00202AD42A|nr:baculoviral IAP repeat-containing protein 7-like isoform X2 [Stegostoma tigrinum]
MENKESMGAERGRMGRVITVWESVEQVSVGRENAQRGSAAVMSTERGRVIPSDPCSIGTWEQFPSIGEPSQSYDLAKAGPHSPVDQLHCLEARPAAGIWYCGGGVCGDKGQPLAVSELSTQADPMGVLTCQFLGNNHAITERADCLKSEWAPNPLQDPIPLRSEAKTQRIFCKQPGSNLCFHSTFLRQWLPVRHSGSEPGRHFPPCSSACDLNNSVDPSLKQQKADTVDGQIISLLQRISVEDSAPPFNIEMEAEEVRLRTYQNWPADIPIQPQQLAHAGFFYTGHRDNVKCFHCDGELRNWELGDNPWMEHAKWFPRCEYLIQMKGRDYVNRIQELHSHITESAFQVRSQPQTSTGQDVTGCAAPSPLMQSAVVKYVLQMGFDRSLIERLVCSKYLVSGSQYSSVSDLLSDLLAAEEGGRERRHQNTGTDQRQWEAGPALTERRGTTTQRRDSHSAIPLADMKVGASTL